MSTYIPFDKDNVVLPSFLKKNLAGQTTKMTTTRLQKLLDDEIQGNVNDFEMPALLEAPIEFKAMTTAEPSQPPSIEETFKKMAEKKIEQLTRQQQQKHKTQSQKEKPQEAQKKTELPSLIHGPQVVMQMVPHIFHTDYTWWNGAFVPVHHHVTLVPQYSYSM